jgi:hypothetical protein
LSVINRKGAMKSIESYKEVKLVEQLFNGINRGANLPLLMTDVAVMGVMSLYSAIALHDNLSLPILLITIFLAFETVVLAQLVMYGAAGDIAR